MITFTKEEEKVIERRREIIEYSHKIDVSKFTDQQIKLLSLWKAGPIESDNNFEEDLSLVPVCESLEDAFEALILNESKKEGEVKPIILSEEEINSSIYHELGHSLILREFFNRDPLFIIIFGAEIDYGEKGILRMSGYTYNIYPPDLYPKSSWREPFLKYVKLYIPPPFQIIYADLFSGLGGLAADIIFNNVSKEDVISEINKESRSKIADIRNFFHIVESKKLPIDNKKAEGIFDEIVQILNSKRDYIINNSKLLKDRTVLTNENFV